MSAVDLRRCDRCQGEFDQNQATRRFDIYDNEHNDGNKPLDLCATCTSDLKRCFDGNTVRFASTPGIGKALWPTP